MPQVLGNLQSLVLDNGGELACKPRCLHQGGGHRFGVYNGNARRRLGSALSDGSSINGGEGEATLESPSGDSLVSFSSSIGGSEVRKEARVFPYNSRQELLIL